MNFIDENTKVYEDGSTGDYYNRCCVCGENFIGHKRDIVCHRQHTEEQPDEEFDPGE